MLSIQGAQAMSRYEIEDNAQFLTDRMAYQLGLTAYQMDEVYAINYDFLYQANPLLAWLAAGDGYTISQYNSLMNIRNSALRDVLTWSQWNAFIGVDYYYRPFSLVDNIWRFAIRFFDPRPRFFYYMRPAICEYYRGGDFICFNRDRGFYANDRRFEGREDSRGMGRDNRRDNGSMPTFADGRSGNNRGQNNGNGNGAGRTQDNNGQGNMAQGGASGNSGSSRSWNFANRAGGTNVQSTGTTRSSFSTTGDRRTAMVSESTSTGNRSSFEGTSSSNRSSRGESDAFESASRSSRSSGAAEYTRPSSTRSSSFGESRSASTRSSFGGESGSRNMGGSRFESAGGRSSSSSSSSMGSSRSSGSSSSRGGGRR